MTLWHNWQVINNEPVLYKCAKMQLNCWRWVNVQILYSCKVLWSRSQ